MCKYNCSYTDLDFLVINLALSKESHRVGAPHPSLSPEDGKKSSFRNILFVRKLENGQFPKLQ
jgi:hypothetical protein